MERMAAYTLVFSALVLCLLQPCSGQETRMSITPPTLRLTPDAARGNGGQFTVTCRPPASNVQVLYSLTILRVLHNNPNANPTSVATARSGILNGQADTDLSTSEAIATGSIDAQNVTLRMLRAKCADGGKYTCQAIYAGASPDPPTITATNSENITVEVTPGNLSMSYDGEPKEVDADGILVYWVNQTLKMTCNGAVGSIDVNTNYEWVWQYQIPDQFNFNPDNWIPYDGEAGDSESAPAVPDSNSPCFKHQGNTLTRVLTLDDNFRVYRCFIRFDNENYDQYAAVHPVGRVVPQGTSLPSGPSSGPDDSTPTKANAGAIAGGVIGGLLVIVIIIVIIVFVMRRRRQKGEEYAADVDPSKPADEAVPPYNPDPSVTYSQPNRFRDKNRGHTNKAMDDVADKPDPYESKPTRYESKPARYENEFNQGQGRRNKAYDDDYAPRGRRNSSDDGGTESYMNNSHASLGQGDPTIGTAI